MSAFVVDDRTINRFISAVSIGRTQNAHIRKILHEETGFDVFTDAGMHGLGAAMLELNCRAVEARYGKGEAKAFRDDLTYRFQPQIAVSPVQAYKSLQCWNYQCCEGDVPDTSLLFATMEKVANELAKQIVSALPGYDRAEWG